MMFIALSAEYLQGIVQVSRFSSIEDGVANIAGIVFALLMFIFCKKWNNTKVAA